MGPAIALRLRQHLTLTPQVQQALKLLQMSALEFAQEMDEALAANPFLEENPEAPAPALRDAATVEDVIVPQEAPSGPAIVLTLFLLFTATYACASLRRPPARA